MDPFLGQVLLFAGNFAPRGWALCNGQLLAINQNTALFSLLGTIYGGDGRTTFALPDLRGRAPIHQGTGPGLSHYHLGQKGGVESVTLSPLEIPSHNHGIDMSRLQGAVDIPVNTEGGGADTSNPGEGVLTKNNADVFASEATANAKYGGQTIPVAITGQATTMNSGASQAHTNIQPFLTMNYIIAVQGVFPSRD